MNKPDTVGLISDIHANYVALQAVLDEMPDVDALVCAGDIVGYGPSPEPCVRELRSRNARTVMGNHDKAVAEGDGSGTGDSYARRSLKQFHIRWLKELPRSVTLFDRQVKVVHDHPEHEGRYVFPTDFAARLLSDEDILILGDTHVQHVETYDEGIMCNPGSVGQPRDGNPDAAYAVLNLPKQSVELRRVTYDIERVQQRIRDRGLSESSAVRLADGS